MKRKLKFGGNGVNNGSVWCREEYIGFFPAKYYIHPTDRNLDI